MMNPDRKTPISTCAGQAHVNSPIRSESLSDVLCAAGRAWRLATGDQSSFASIELLKGRKHRPWKGKSLVCRLLEVGGSGQGVVAKRTTASGASLEYWIYSSLLPDLGVRGPVCLGMAPCQETDGKWLFLEDAGDDASRVHTPAGRELLSTWLAELHVAAVDLDHPPELPSRDAKYFLGHLDSSLAKLAALQEGTIDNAALGAIRSLETAFSGFRARWNKLAELAAWPWATVVHCDLVSKNIRVTTHPQSAVYVFDWEMAGWGPPAPDLGGSTSVSLDAYRHACKTRGTVLPLPSLERTATIGRLFRLLSSVDWCTADEGHYGQRTQQYLQAYARWLPRVEAEVVRMT